MPRPPAEQVYAKAVEQLRKDTLRGFSLQDPKHTLYERGESKLSRLGPEIHGASEDLLSRLYEELFGSGSLTEHERNEFDLQMIGGLTPGEVTALYGGRKSTHSGRASLAEEHATHWMKEQRPKPPAKTEQAPPSKPFPSRAVEVSPPDELATPSAEAQDAYWDLWMDKLDTTLVSRPVDADAALETFARTNGLSSEELKTRYLERKELTARGLEPWRPYEVLGSPKEVSEWALQHAQSPQLPGYRRLPKWVPSLAEKVEFIDPAGRNPSLTGDQYGAWMHSLSVVNGGFASTSHFFRDYYSTQKTLGDVLRLKMPEGTVVMSLDDLVSASYDNYYWYDAPRLADKVEYAKQEQGEEPYRLRIWKEIMRLVAMAQ